MSAVFESTYSPDTNPAPARRGLVRRHLAGELPLAKAYWGTMVLGTMGLAFAGILIVVLTSKGLAARYSSISFLGMAGLGAVYWLWAALGTWASASRHASRGGRRFWAIAVKALILLGLFKSVGDVQLLIPAVQEHWRVAAGGQPGEPHRLELRVDGKSIRVSGGINDGVGAALDEMLARTPTIRTVVLSSPGGWIREGEKLADVIRKHGLDTYVEDACESSCTIALLAGRDRAAAPQAKIGFHSSRRIGESATGGKVVDRSDLQRLYHQAGVSPTFIRQALDTSHDSMWYPSHDEMFEAGVLNRRSKGGETAALATSLRDRDALAGELRKLALFTDLADRHPAEFDKVVSSVWSEVRRGGTDAQILAVVRQTLPALLNRMIFAASDDDLQSFHLLNIDRMRHVRRRDASTCVAMIQPGGQPTHVVTDMPAELVARERDLLGRVIQDADFSRAVGASVVGADRVVAQAAARLGDKELRIIHDASARQHSAPSAVCDAYYQLMKGFAAMPARERVAALRVFYASH